MEVVKEGNYVISRAFWLNNSFELFFSLITSFFFFCVSVNFAGFFFF